MERTCLFLTSQQREIFASLAAQTGLKSADLMRRVLDQVGRPEVLNAAVPHLSGQLRVATR